jgi:coproporphyrinogen III oxidase-like Fe-S oxidoreductase
LRLVEGIELARLTPLGVTLDAQKLSDLRAAGVLQPSQTHLIASPQGRLVLDQLIAELLA